MFGFIYMWTNKINGKKYIGSHKGDINDGYIGSGIHFSNAIKKYGIENFEREILEHVENVDNILEREQYYLDKHNASKNEDFYNIKEKAGGGFEHINNNMEHKLRNVERLKMRWKIHPHPKGMLGKTHPNHEPARKALKEYTDSIKKRIEQWDVYGNYIRTFDSLTEAAKSVNGSPSNIKYTADGKFKTSYKYVWKWAD